MNINIEFKSPHIITIWTCNENSFLSYAYGIYMNLHIGLFSHIKTTLLYCINFYEI